MSSERKLMADVNIDINVVAQQALASLKRIEGQAAKTQGGFSRLSKAVIVFNQGFQLVRSVGGTVVNALSKVVNKAKELEQLETRFAVLTRSAGTAKKVMADLQKFAATTPFQLPGIADASAQLLAFGFRTDEIIPKLQQIGDVAAGSGSNLQEVALIFGQVSAAGKLTGERLLQFQERAIPIGPAIAKTMGIMESEVRDAVSKGLVDFATFEKAFASLSQEGGLFFEGMIKQSKTLGGVFSTLSDNFDLIISDIGQSFLPMIKEAAIGIIGFLQANREIIKSKALEYVGIAMNGINASMQAFVQIKTFAIAGINGLQNAFLSSLQAVNSVVSGYLQAKIAIKELVGANTEAEESELKLLQIRQQTAEELKKQNEDEAVAAIEKADRQTASIEEEFARIQESNAMKEEEETRHQEAVTTAQADSMSKRKVNEASFTDSFKNELGKRKKFEEISDQERIQNFQSTMGTIATLSDANNKAIGAAGKSAAVANSLINSYRAYNVALASAPPPFNFVLAGATLAAGLQSVSKIVGAKAFQTGGIVPGTGNRDTVPAMLTPGELILNRSQQDNLAGGMGSNVFNINIEAGVVEDNDTLVDGIVSGINRGLEFRNLQLRTA